MDNRNMMKNMQRNYEDDMMKQREVDKIKKQDELDKDMRFLNAIEYQKMLDRQKKLEDRMKMKSDFDIDLERSKGNRQVRFRL
jgi:hypothetical protein